MALHRVAVRIAALEALAPSAAFAGTAPYGTLAGPRVYDSRQDPVDELDNIEAYPQIMLFTEDDAGDPYGTGETNPDRHSVALVAEMQIAVRGVTDVTLPDGSSRQIGVAEVPVSDPQHEALLDLMEWQIEYALRYSPAGALFRRFATIRTMRSVPLRVANTKTRLAHRTFTMHLDPLGTVAPDPTFSPPAAGLAGLPEPLKGLAAALPAGSRNLALLADIADLIQSPGQLTQGISFNTTWTLGGQA